MSTNCTICGKPAFYDGKGYSQYCSNTCRFSKKYVPTVAVQGQFLCAAFLVNGNFCNKAAFPGSIGCGMAHRDLAKSQGATKPR